MSSLTEAETKEEAIPLNRQDSKDSDDSASVAGALHSKSQDIVVDVGSEKLNSKFTAFFNQNTKGGRHETSKESPLYGGRFRLSLGKLIDHSTNTGRQCCGKKS